MPISAPVGKPPLLGGIAGGGDNAVLIVRGADIALTVIVMPRTLLRRVVKADAVATLGASAVWTARDVEDDVVEMSTLIRTLPDVTVRTTASGWTPAVWANLSLRSLRTDGV